MILPKPLLILGAGGHTKVLLETLFYLNKNIIGILDLSLEPNNVMIRGIPVIGSDELISNYSPDQATLVNGLGSVSSPQKRMLLYKKFKQMGYRFESIIHPSSIISKDILIGEGVQIMAGAIVQPGCTLGNNIIINTKASIDHDTHISDHTHIAPGVTMSGNVYIGETTHIGIGATIIQGVRIGSGVTVGAGAVVLKDITNGSLAYGVPAKEIYK